jgi:hypothetical protein
VDDVKELRIHSFLRIYFKIGTAFGTVGVSEHYEILKITDHEKVL